MGGVRVYTRGSERAGPRAGPGTLVGQGPGRRHMARSENLPEESLMEGLCTGGRAGWRS